MRRSLVPAIILLLATVSFAQSMEDTVRLTYAKLIFANQVGAIEKNTMFNAAHPNNDIAQVLKDNELSINLSNFKPGTVMGNTAPLTSLTSDFTGKQFLNIGPQTNNFTGEHGEKWTEESVNSIIVQQDERTAVDDSQYVIGDLNTLVSTENDPRRWSKLINYDVTVTYKGKTVSYTSAFLFTDAGEAETLDQYLVGLGSFITAKVYPEVLLHRLNDNPAVVEWVKANTAPADKSRPGQMYCDLVTLKCLIPVDVKVSTVHDPVGTH